MNSPGSLPEDKMFVPPDTTHREMVLIACGNAMEQLAHRMEINEAKGLPASSGFTMLALDVVEARALAELLQKAKIPKELRELRKCMKPKNFITMRKGGQG